MTERRRVPDWFWGLDDVGLCKHFCDMHGICVVDMIVMIFVVKQKLMTKNGMNRSFSLGFGNS